MLTQWQSDTGGIIDGGASKFQLEPPGPLAFRCRPKVRHSPFPEPLSAIIQSISAPSVTGSALESTWYVCNHRTVRI